MCVLCAASADEPDAVRRVHVLNLLALIEHPDALPSDAALRLACEAMALIRAGSTGFRCDPVVPSGTTAVGSSGRSAS